FQQYLPITRQYTFAFNTELGVGKGLGGKPFPVLRNFYGGGLGSVRGFEQGTLGPTSAVIGSTTGETVNIGGARNIVFNAEFIAPFPGAGNDRTLSWFAFVDAGNVYGESESVDFSKMRSSVGVGLSWISPVGPLRFALANPVRKFSGDRIQKFQFQIGTSF
ncbi:MAG: outer membrane protein assembly factor BamA, partial [Burkholderiaceae bacterium]